MPKVAAASRKATTSACPATRLCSMLTSSDTTSSPRMPSTIASAPQHSRAAAVGVTTPAARRVGTASAFVAVCYILGHRYILAAVGFTTPAARRLRWPYCHEPVLQHVGTVPRLRARSTHTCTPPKHAHHAIAHHTSRIIGRNDTVSPQTHDLPAPRARACVLPHHHRADRDLSYQTPVSPATAFFFQPWRHSGHVARHRLRV